MKEKILELIESNVGIFWREFIHLMVYAEEYVDFNQLRDIFENSADEADAKARLRSLAEGLE